jgi:hypothetical protein
MLLQVSSIVAHMGYNRLAVMSQCKRTGYRLVKLKNLGTNLARKERFDLHHSVQTGSETHPARRCMVLGGCFNRGGGISHGVWN